MKWIEDQQVVTPEALGNWDVIPAEWLEKGRKKDYKLLYQTEPPAEGPQVHK